MSANIAFDDHPNGKRFTDHIETSQDFCDRPMCIVNRISSEPPSHLNARAMRRRSCPFLVTLLRAQRREANMPEDAAPPLGVSVLRNPGVVALWTTHRWEFVRAPGGFLFTVGEPEHVEWFAEGRATSADEVRASFDSGIRTA